MTGLQLSMPPFAAGTSCATVKPNATRPVTALPPASFTVKTTLGLIGGVAGMLTDVISAKLRTRGPAEDTALCMAMASASWPAPWQSEQVSWVIATGAPGVAGVPGVPAGPVGPVGPGVPAGPSGPGCPAGPSVPTGPAQPIATAKPTTTNHARPRATALCKQDSMPSQVRDTRSIGKPPPKEPSTLRTSEDVVP